MGKLPGITRQEEEQKLERTIRVAKEKVEANKENIRALAEELHAMQEEFDESDKEMQTLWHDTDARFKFVNQDLKRAEQARKKPYFGRIDFTDSKIGKEEVYYIGRSVIADNPAEPEVIDWRAPIAGVYYDSALGEVTYSVKGEGKCRINLTRKRTYEIENEILKDFYDSDVVANDELLTKYLAKNKRAVLGEIIATIQQEQNEVIRKKPQHNLIIQGAAGSGKTTVAMHRISYILYNYEQEFAPEDFYIIGSNQVLLNYITGVLPELNVYGVKQMTMEQLFIRLLYEEWDKHKYHVKKARRGETPAVKGTWKWFLDLEAFCDEYENRCIPQNEVRLEKNNVLLLSETAIRDLLEDSRKLSRADKITRLTENLLAKLENEISGKYYSYSQSEKQKLIKYYTTYFGKREWKGSVFDLYEEFLLKQNAKGAQVPVPDKEFDVYDLAALAYLYKRIKEDEIIREAGHVVIDEAQDFGMMAYGCLKYCLSKCTYTIMGDVSQNISLDYGLNDWSELRKLMLPDKFDYFGLLRKSYRNTVEISHFATNILCHGSFSIYPVEPIIRHGKEVLVEKQESYEAMVDRTKEILDRWQQDGMETIAVVCANEKEVERLTGMLEGKVPLLSTKADSMEFKEGIMVLSLEYTKGLEFDAVLLFDASDENYPMEDGYVKRLYVAATRALHELVVLYSGQLTRMIADPVPEGRLEKAMVKVSTPKPRFVLPEEERTKEEIYREEALLAEKQRSERDTYGPRKISTADLKPQRDSGFSLKGQAFGANKDGKVQTYLERVQEELNQLRPTVKKVTSKNRLAEFGSMPDTSNLQVPGHARIDCSVKLVRKGKGCLDFLSSYGTLRITPISPNVVRICFAKGQYTSFPEPPTAFRGLGGKVKLREGIGLVELVLEKLTVRVDKKTGAITFLNSQGKAIANERVTEPRQIGDNKVWEFLEWKKEELMAKGPEEGNILAIGKSARYISYGSDSPDLPSLAVSTGYEIILPPKVRTLVCAIPSYGTYISFEGVEFMDYYFKAK